VLNLIEELFVPPGGFPGGYTRERGTDGFRHAVDNPDADVLIALDGGRVVGIATVYKDYLSIRDGWRCWLQDLVVTSASRSQGVGSRLLAAAADWARERECTHLDLASGLARADAHRFYEREGMIKGSYDFRLRLQRER
jgi:GNAT superfamily N-acetyltransferase